jgi:hypothetical protein
MFPFSLFGDKIEYVYVAFNFGPSKLLMCTCMMVQSSPPKKMLQKYVVLMYGYDILGRNYKKLKIVQYLKIAELLFCHYFHGEKTNTSTKDRDQHEIPNKHKGAR